MVLNILLGGATGKVGRQIERLAAEDDHLAIAGRATREAFFEPDTPADVVVDFSRPELSARCIEFALDRGLPCVIGTTGFDDLLQSRLQAASREIPVLQSANFSIGINLLLVLARQAGGALGEDFDAEIFELHHRWKVDAPSGTALALGRAVAEGRGRQHGDVAVEDRDGARQRGEIGYQSARGGDVAGEHTVMFLGDGERVELAHKATDRAVFARGALRAADWLVGQPPGLYSMGDVLG